MENPEISLQKAMSSRESKVRCKVVAAEEDKCRAAAEWAKARETKADNNTTRADLSSNSSMKEIGAILEASRETKAADSTGSRWAEDKCKGSAACSRVNRAKGR
ncbi:MAG: hypothetical protein ABI361_09810 [Nitrososphaera sp.]